MFKIDEVKDYLNALYHTAKTMLKEQKNPTRTKNQIIQKKQKI